MSVIKPCAACRTEKPVSEMETCMHAEMHYYVCDSKCMSDFYNPPKKPSAQSELEALRARVAELEKDLARLAEIGGLIRNQDNRLTDRPIFCVMEKRAMVVCPERDHDRIEWCDPEQEYRTADDRTARRLEALHKGCREFGTWERLAIKDVPQFVTACFTEQGCKDYLAVNGHNLRQPFICAFGSYRNAEYNAVRDFLSGLRGKDGEQ